MAIAATSLVFACADDEKTPTADDEVGDGDGDGETAGETVGDGDGEPGDGDGEPGDGDGEPGDGDGEPGDGDGEPGDGDGEPGDGDGEPGDGDGDGEASEECQMAADTLAAELMQAEGNCTILVRFNHESLAPISWASICAAAPEEMITEDAARKLSTCCAEGDMLGGAEGEMFVFYSQPDPEGGVSVISKLLGQLAFEGTFAMGEAGDIQQPQDWRDAGMIGSDCGGMVPPGTGYDLTMDGAELDAMALDGVMAALADTALPLAIEQNGMIQHTLTIAYPRTVGPVDPATAEYVVIIETAAGGD